MDCNQQSTFAEIRQNTPPPTQAHRQTPSLHEEVAVVAVAAAAVKVSAAGGGGGGVRLKSGKPADEREQRCQTAAGTLNGASQHGGDCSAGSDCRLKREGHRSSVANGDHQRVKAAVAARRGGRSDHPEQHCRLVLHFFDSASRLGAIPRFLCHLAHHYFWAERCCCERSCFGGGDVRRRGNDLAGHRDVGRHVSVADTDPRRHRHHCSSTCREKGRSLFP